MLKHGKLLIDVAGEDDKFVCQVSNLIEEVKTRESRKPEKENKNPEEKLKRESQKKEKHSKPEKDFPDPKTVQPINKKKKYLKFNKKANPHVCIVRKAFWKYRKDLHENTKAPSHFDVFEM